MKALLEREKALLVAQPDLNHNPMLGDMYEGLAKHVVAGGIFKDLDLHVADGKIRLGDGTLSDQMDIIVGYGPGTNLPYTAHRIYEWDKVLAVVEVKKTLYGPQIDDAFSNLRSAREIDPNWNPKRGKLLQHAWRGIMRRDYPLEGEPCTVTDNMIRISLKDDVLQPVRIVFGYSGYASEKALRDGFVEFLKGQFVANGKKPGFGVVSMPDLVICGNASLVKLNGMPYSAAFKDGFWPVIASHSLNPFRSLLELIWTRLSYFHNLPSDIFGDDLEMEAVHPLLDARWHGAGGWEYKYHKMTSAELAEGPATVPWAPTQIDMVVYVILKNLSDGKIERVDNPKLIEWLETKGITVGELTDSLLEKGFAFVKDGEIRLLMDQLVFQFSNGGCLVGDDRTGRFSRWLAKSLHAKKA
jgi:hypothetical protein